MHCAFTILVALALSPVALARDSLSVEKMRSKLEKFAPGAPVDPKNRNRFVPDLAPDATLPGRTYVVFNHSSSIFDYRGSSYAANRALVGWARERRVPSITVVDDYSLESPSANTYYVGGSETNFTLQSAGGAHELRFPNADTLIFGGGNLTYCLCESLRDSLRGANFPGRELRIILPMDAVYDYVGDAWRAMEVKKAFVPPVSRNHYDHMKFDTGAEIFGQAGWENFAKYFETLILGGFHGFCPKQSSGKAAKPNPHDFTFEIRREGEWLATLGGGKKRVKIELTETAKLDETITRMGEAPEAAHADLPFSAGESKRLPWGACDETEAANAD